MVRFKVPKCLTLLEAFRRPLNLPKDSANSAVLRYFYASPLRAWTGMPNAHGTSCRRSEGRDRENGDGILVMNGVAVLVHACLLFLFHCCLSCWLFDAQLFKLLAVRGPDICCWYSLLYYYRWGVRAGLQDSFYFPVPHWKWCRRHHAVCFFDVLSLCPSFHLRISI